MIKEQAEFQADLSNQAPRPGTQSVSKGSVDEGNIDPLRKVEREGRIEKLASFVGDLMVHQEEASGFLGSPVG